MNSVQFHFSKYEGAGNDFVIVDDRDARINLTAQQISGLCDRRFGIGCDGLILLRMADGCDYEMVYYNADGNIGSMCGNGARCAFAFAKSLGVVSDEARFMAYDGLHQAKDAGGGLVSVTMRDVAGCAMDQDAYVLDTGSPHYVAFVPKLSAIDVVKAGKAIRYSKQYSTIGINVNFVEDQGGILRMSTYERGVEDRTLACGTGATAVALAYADKNGLLEGPVRLEADGGNMSVDFRLVEGKFCDVILTGPATHVFNGVYSSMP